MALRSVVLGPGWGGKWLASVLCATALRYEVVGRRRGKLARLPVGRQAALDALAVYRPGQIARAGEGTVALMVPQSNIYRRGLFGGATLCGCAMARGVVTARMAIRYSNAFFIDGSISCAGA